MRGVPAAVEEERNEEEGCRRSGLEVRGVTTHASAPNAHTLTDTSIGAVNNAVCNTESNLAGAGGMSRSGDGGRVSEACPDALPDALGDAYAAVRDTVYYVSAEKYVAVKDACYYSSLAQQLCNEAVGI
jgi:hypothetical protein